MRRAVIDDQLGVRVVSRRALVYTQPAEPDQDRPDHVRAASGLALLDDTLYVIQDDASFIARVRGDDIDAIAIPYAPGGRRRFETRLGNRLEKLDLEACLLIERELIAFGSGSLPVRDRVCRLHGERVTVVEAAALYANVREAIGSAINLEGATRVGGELWLFHRGNTGPGDGGPAVARIELAAFVAWLEGRGEVPAVIGVDRYDLGAIDGVPIGFTDAACVGDRVFYVAVAEASPDAIQDAELVGAQIGVIAGGEVRATALVLDGPLPKAEGLLFDPEHRARGWITIDPDDPDVPSSLFEIEITGPWW
jgi:hypothetical protein